MEFGIGEIMLWKAQLSGIYMARYFCLFILLPFSAYDFNYPLQVKQELITVEVTPEITNFDEGD